jgi:hypothetical protein
MADSNGGMAPSNAELQRMRWTNLEARKLLRLMRRPHALERERLAVLLRQATQKRDSREALRAVIEEAFDVSDDADRLRFEIIRRCDMEGQTTRAAASALHLSIRQFFRYRADAIDAITQSIERALRRPPDSHNHLLQLARMVETVDPRAALDIYSRVARDDSGEVAYNVVRTSVWAGLDVTQDQIDACEGPWRLLALAAVARHLIARGETQRAAVIRDELRENLDDGSGPRYAPAAFELAFLDRCEACRRADAAESARLLDRLRAYAGQNESLLALTMISEADQALTDGDLTAAAVALNNVELLDVHGHDLTIVARTALEKAKLSLVRGFHEEAFALANGAAPVIAALEGGFALRAAGIAGRAALLCGAGWVPPRALLEKFPRVWTKALTEAVAARHVVVADPTGSRALAESAFALASHHASPVLMSYAQIALAAAMDVTGDDLQAQRLRVAALDTALRCGDHFAMYDLFCVPGTPAHDIGCMKLDRGLLLVLQAHLDRSIPGYATAFADTSEAMRVLEGALRVAAGSTARGLRPVNGSRNAHELTLAGKAAGQVVSCFLLPGQRDAFRATFLRTWHDATALEIPEPDHEAQAG